MNTCPLFGKSILILWYYHLSKEKNGFTLTITGGSTTINSYERSLWTSTFDWLISYHKYSDSPLSASCFDAILFIWFKLDSSSRLSCFSRLLSRTIFFLFFSRKSLFFAQIQFQRWTISHLQKGKNELLLFKHCCFLFESIALSLVSSTLARIQKISYRREFMTWNPFRKTNIIMKIIVYSFWKNYSCRFLSTNGKSFVVCGFLSGCVYCMPRQETNAQFIGATMAYGDKQLRHPNWITWEISKRLTESRTLRAFVFYFLLRQRQWKESNRSNWCVCVCVPLDYSVASTVMTTEMMMVRSATERI